MNSLNRSSLCLVLACSFAPFMAMDTNQNNNNNNNHIPKFEFKNPDRDNGLGTLSQLPDEKIFEIMLFCINWDKTTLEEPFRTIQNLCETSTYLYTLAHSMLFDSKLVAELRKRIELITEMEKYKKKMLDSNSLKQGVSFISEINAIHIAVSLYDLAFLEHILPRLKEANLNNQRFFSELILNESNPVTSHKVSYNLFEFLAFGAIFDAMPDAESLDHQYLIWKILLEHGAKCSIKQFLIAAERDSDHKITILTAKYITCEQIRSLQENKEYEDAVVQENVKALLKEHHKCNICKFE